MLQIAIVEDNPEAAAQLEQALRSYCAEYRTALQIHLFPDPTVFLARYRRQFHIVFLDILMPSMNGMDAARKLRTLDNDVMLIFVTSLQQYAVQGYEVNAADYILKPLVYEHFRLKMSRFLAMLQDRRPELGQSILIRSEEGLIRLPTASIRYVEVQGHLCCYHTASADYTLKQSIGKAESELAGLGFARCNSNLLVNLACVTAVRGYEVHLGNTVLKISQPRKKAFSRKYAEFKESCQYA